MARRDKEVKSLEIKIGKVSHEIFSGDDQDLDDRVIKKLWEENQELRLDTKNN